MPRISHAKRDGEKVNKGFAGFALPTSNTTYCPNQFFDVCLPHGSRGVVRIVAFMLRKTLGWCDAEGKPKRERFTITYSEIQSEAGLNRDMIRNALQEAEQSHFIRCLCKPRAKKAGQDSVSGLYELCWDEGHEYIKDANRFRGFFAGEGNRTYIPNQFFDHVVRHEPLAVIKVVGSVIRFSIGFQTKWGHRRQQVALSYQDIQRYSHLRDRKTLSQALSHALGSNYVERVADGYFDPNGGRLSKAAVYSIKWRNRATDSQIGRKTPPEKIEAENRSENTTGIGRKTLPADRSEKPTDIQIKDTNNNNKGAAVAFEELKREGFDEAAAKAIAKKFPVERIVRQIEWIGRRKAKSNRLGLLRRAIEEDWSRPQQGRAPAGELGRPNLEGEARSLDDSLEAARRRLLNPHSPTS